MRGRLLRMSIFFEDGRVCLVCERRALFFTFFDLQAEPYGEKPFCTPKCIDTFYEERKIAKPNIYPITGGERTTSKLKVVYAPIPCLKISSTKLWFTLARKYGVSEEIEPTLPPDPFLEEIWTTLKSQYTKLDDTKRGDEEE